MGDLPVDARRIVDELIETRKERGIGASWMPSESFESVLDDAMRVRITDNENLTWMHGHWGISDLLGPPPGKGLKGRAKRLVHRAIMSVLRPYLDRLQEYVSINTRATDLVTRRCDDLAVSQIALVGAMRHDMVDLAHHVDEKLGS